jgi:DNA-binding response OmpR family regulator
MESDRPSVPATVLVVEDEGALAEVVASYLRREGFNVDLAYDGPGAVSRARVGNPDLIVLDLMLPGFDGIEVCRQVRTFSDCYIVMLTARDEEVDKLVGLSVGADDYIVKPFSPRELVARARAMLRRPRHLGHTGSAGEPSADDIAPWRFGAVVIDPVARSVSHSGEPVDLTRTEFDLLAAMAAHPRMAFSRRQLIEAVWGEGWYGDEHVVDVHVGHLRRKLGDDATTPRVIRTVRGVGYGMAPGP